MATTQDARRKLTIARAQENLYSLNVAKMVCKVDSKTTGTIYNPYTTLPAIANGTVSSAAYNIRDYAATADNLQVNRRITLSEHVDSFDEYSTNFGLMRDRSDNFGSGMSNEIDRYVFGSVVGNGGFALGDGGVTSATAWAITSANADDLINSAIETIDINEGHGKKKFMVVSPVEANSIRGFLQNAGFGVADDAIKGGGFARTNGFVGTTVSGVDIYQTNNLRNTVTLALATAVTADDNVTINGITFTWVASIGTAAGNVLRSATAATNATNLAGLINAPRTTSANQVALSEENAAKVERMGLSATATGTNVVISATTTLLVSSDLTAGADGFGNVSRYVVSGAYESIFLALPGQTMDYIEKDVSGKHGKELVMSTLFNTTIWTRVKPLVGTTLVRKG
jgi:hypothetical protein